MKTLHHMALMLCPMWVSAHAATELVVATVNNSHMVTMQKLSPVFEKEKPDIKVKWMVLQESALRARVSADIANKSGQFDVVMIGMYETPIWAKKGWLEEIKPDARYDVNTRMGSYRNAHFNLPQPDTDATLPHSPYVGLQFAAIPKFQVVGQATGNFVNEALAGKLTVAQALHAAQLAADQEMRKAGYYKWRFRVRAPPRTLPAISKLFCPQPIRFRLDKGKP